MKFIHSSIEIELFGASKNNIFVISSKNKILNSFLNKKEYYLTQYERKFSNVKPIEWFIGDSIYKALTRSNLLLPTTIAEDLLRSNNISKQEIFDNFENYSGLINIAIEIRNQCLIATEFYIYEDGSGGMLISLIELKLFSNPKVYNDIDSAIIKRYSASRKVEDFDTAYNDFNKKLERIRKRLQSTIKTFRESLLLASKIAEYKLWAEYLLAQSNPKIKCGKSLDILSWEGENMTIPLDEKLNLLDNAAKYYKKAKKIKDSIEQKNILLPKYEKKLYDINLIFDKLKTIENVKELLKFKKK